ncbi:hypothetical protein N7532_000457 [Penicillium argentinense]|uniref:Uncharacterized protein n=1 Tax=Penicillium argentinense TaxID=1131581 RepID=A0A9W9KNW0_9EURO|nr:uncharacterized protein N7532_000457 [Penicillium argentinense]KAJ5112412.1 hypothetical protein N7532_000457 [Penicillium argentinense]
MSSQFPGRQSPEPELLSGAQQRDVPGSGKIGSSMSSSSKPAPEFAQKKSNEQKQEHLTSNPVHALEKIEAAKYAK